MTRLRRLGPRAAFVAATLGVPTLAWADVVGPPPEECPVGSIPDQCHGPELCRPQSCEPGDCPAGYVCTAVQLCVETINCGGMSYDPTPSAVGPCTPAGGCTMINETCESVMACLAEGGDSTATQGASSASGASGASDGGSGGAVDRGCACTTGASTLGFGVLPLILVGAVLRRRRYHHGDPRSE